MIAYEVTVELDEALVDRYVAYMKSHHIPALLATGCFAHAELDRANETRFRVRYLAATLGDLERYLEEHAPALRLDFDAHFPSGTRVSREIWEEVHRWSPS
ncbi:MAG TPA: DUF4286 family protein [Gemmatimonadales bacterium]|nr:DUF4286 family protein [Gemmatimonadales bacterium]